MTLPRLALMSLLALATVPCLPSQAAAQETVELSEAQRQLNDEGVAAIVAGDHAAAIVSLKSSLALGESNVAWLNLGRALHRSGDCIEAAAAYEAAALAPQVTQPTPAEVADVLARYRSELDPAACPGQLVLTCRPSTVEVSIDGEEPTSCPDRPVRLDAGDHEVVAVFRDERRTETVTIGGMESTALSIVFDPLAKPDPVAVDDGIGAVGIAGWALVGVGTASLVTAIVLETTVLADYADRSGVSLTSDDIDTAETLQGVNLGLYIGGGVLAAAGVTMVVIDAVSGDASAAEQTGAQRITPLVWADGLGASWRVAF